MRHSFISISVLTAVAFLSGCLAIIPPSIETSLQTATAKVAYTEAEKYARQQYPEAVLIGYNTHGNTVDRANYTAFEKIVTGETPFWMFIFAQSPAVIADGQLSDNEAFGIGFKPGKLTFYDISETRDLDIEKDEPIGPAMISTDSPEVLEKSLAKIEEEFGKKITPYHVDFRFLPDLGEITIMIDDTHGYEVHFDQATGETGYTRAIVFQSL